MGHIINALIGRSPKAEKLKMLLNLAISRIATLKNLHAIRCSQAESDIIQLLQLNLHERALQRVELYMKEQNKLDAFVMIENCCHLMGERTDVIRSNRECPDELKEVISNLIFAASRCGEFPELQQIRTFFTDEFGKEFAANAVELRNNCGVYPKMIQRLSTSQASLESKKKLLKQIAKYNGIPLQLEHEDSDTPIKENSEVEEIQKSSSDESGGGTLEANVPTAITQKSHFPEAATSSETELSD